MAPNRPYPVGSLHAPLSEQQRQALISWLQSSGGFDFAKWWSSLTKMTTDAYIKAGHSVSAIELDYMILAQYNNTIKGAPMPPEPSGTGAITAVPGDVTGHLLSILTASALWTRVAEFTVGGILVAVGVNAMLRQGIGSNAPQIHVPTGLKKGASQFLTPKKVNPKTNPKAPKKVNPKTNPKAGVPKGQ